MAARSPGRAFRRLSTTCWAVQSPTFATNSGVFIDHDIAYLVDPGMSPAELDEIAGFVTTAGATVRGIVLTHAHWDHLLGPRRFPGVPVIAHRAYGAVVRAHSADLVRQVAAWEREMGYAADSGPAFSPPRPSLTFSDRLVLSTGDLTLHLIAAPGHAPDQIVVFDPATGLLWAGDMLSDLEIPMAMSGVAAYRETLARLVALEVRVLVPGHGSATADIDAIRTRFAQDQDYLARVAHCVAGALAESASPGAAVARCEGLPFAQPDSYAHAHRRNIEQAYLELGGQPEGVMGWAEDWL